MREKLPNIRHVDKRKITEELKKINEVIEFVPIDSITELNDTFYASVEIVTQKLAKNRKEYEEPPWKRRLKTRVQEIQKEISRVKEAMNRYYNDRLRRWNKDMTSKRNSNVFEELK